MSLDSCITNSRYFEKPSGDSDPESIQISTDILRWTCTTDILERRKYGLLVLAIDSIREKGIPALNATLINEIQRFEKGTGWAFGQYAPSEAFVRRVAMQLKTSKDIEWIPEKYKEDDVEGLGGYAIIANGATRLMRITNECYLGLINRYLESDGTLPIDRLKEDKTFPLEFNKNVLFRVTSLIETVLKDEAGGRQYFRINTVYDAPEPPSGIEDAAVAALMADAMKKTLRDPPLDNANKTYLEIGSEDNLVTLTTRALEGLASRGVLPPDARFRIKETGRALVPVKVYETISEVTPLATVSDDGDYIFPQKAVAKGKVKIINAALEKADVPIRFLYEQPAPEPEKQASEDDASSDYGDFDDDPDLERMLASFDSAAKDLGAKVAEYLSIDPSTVDIKALSLRTLANILELRKPL